LLRRILTAIVVIPIALVMIAFAVANRHSVTISLDPFASNDPVASATVPLFALIFLFLIVGVFIGGAASWLRHGRWRWMARRLEAELRKLRVKIATIEGGEGPSVPGLQQRPPPPRRSQLRPPAA
jgi:uncharacterized integral membrane protein